MADFIAGDAMTNGSNSSSHSRQSSMSSERSQGQQNKENTNTPTNALITRRDSEGSDLSSGQLVLRDGGRLAEESRTDVMAGLLNPAFNGVKKGGDSESSMNINSLEIPPRQPSGSGTGTARHKVNKSGNMAYTIPEVEITIPNDGCLASFSADAMATFFRYVRLEDRLINHLHRNGLDGRKFGRLKDSDLDNLQINNPIIVYFRDRTAPAVAKKNKQRLPFVL